MTAKRYTPPVAPEFRTATDPNKVTMKLHKGRLCCWSGSVQRWIHKDDSGEISADGVPMLDEFGVQMLGHVPAVRITQPERVLAHIPRFAPVIRAGFPVVIKREELPEGVRGIV